MVMGNFTHQLFNISYPDIMVVWANLYSLVQLYSRHVIAGIRIAIHLAVRRQIVRSREFSKLQDLA